MQLLAIVLYHGDGRVRRLNFKPGALNIVTGQSETGKSALLTIIDYCLGRAEMNVPVGIISNTVAWYGALWEIEDTGPQALRAFVGRPKPADGARSTTVAMLEMAVGLEPPAFDGLKRNSDTTQLRLQLGRHIGIEESAVERSFGRSTEGMEASLGHAALLCLQSQSEVANQALMFHRQGEVGIEQGLRDTIPYFLGAVPRDQARKRAQLREARRTLARLQEAYDRAALDASTIDAELGALLTEARSVGLIPAAEQSPNGGEPQVLTRGEVFGLLADARSAAEPTAEVSDTAQQDNLDQLQADRERLNRELRDALDERDLLLKESRAANEVAAAFDQQRGRLTSLGLIEATALIPSPPQHSEDTEPRADGPEVADTADGAAGAEESEATTPAAPEVETEAHDCPVCRSQLAEPDPTAAALHRGLLSLSAQISTVSSAQPPKRRALRDLDERVHSLRQSVRSIEAAIGDLTRAGRISRDTIVSSRDFTRGRIDAILARATVTDTFLVEALRSQLQTAQEQVATLAAELAEDQANQDELNARLAYVGDRIRAYASTLDLEHSSGTVLLDLAQLTVLASTDEGTAPLSRIGSAKNWVGYHIATHLGLHEFFVSRNRPVPRFLILDQPTQAHYPADDDNEVGQPEDDADRIAVRAMFRLMYDFVAEVAPRFQIIVCDHADLPEEWFQASVGHRWREGKSEIPALIPASWLEEAPGSNAPDNDRAAQMETDDTQP